jgi:hypothetical protein
MFLCAPPNHCIHRFIANLTQQVPYCEVNAGNDGDGKPLSSIKHRGTEHLVPQHVCVPWVRTEKESLKVCIYDPARGRASKAGGKPRRPVGRLDRDAERPENVYPPLNTRGLVLGVARPACVSERTRAVRLMGIHWIGYGTVDDPVTSALGMIVRTIALLRVCISIILSMTGDNCWFTYAANKVCLDSCNGWKSF